MYKALFQTRAHLGLQAEVGMFRTSTGWSDKKKTNDLPIMYEQALFTPISSFISIYKGLKALKNFNMTSKCKALFVNIRSLSEELEERTFHVKR